MKRQVYKTKSKIDISSIPLLSFFTGAGFLDLGFHIAGFQNIVWRNEFNQNFARGFDYAMDKMIGKNHGITALPQKSSFPQTFEAILNSFGASFKSLSRNQVSPQTQTLIESDSKGYDKGFYITLRSFAPSASCFSMNR